MSTVKCIYDTLISILAISLMPISISCQSNLHADTLKSTVDSTLQAKATSILKNKLYDINALSGQVIVMEVQSGQIKALVGLERKDSANYQSCENFSQAHESALIQPISILAALETGKIHLSNKVNVGNGVYSIHGRELKDLNWHRGGYGEITIKRGLAVSSNIAIYKTIENTFGNNPQSYFDLLDKMNYGKPDSITGIPKLDSAFFVTPKDKGWSNTALAWFCIGYNQSIAPIQMLTFYNAIANNGKMVQPQLYKGNTVIINPQIAKQANIDSLKQTLQYVVTDGLGQSAKSDKVQVAGRGGTVQLEDGSYIIEFCGYFPANKPKYSIIISIHKEGLPASGELMAGNTFKDVTEIIKDN